MPAAGMAEIGLGEVLCERNDLESATRLLTHGLPLLQGTTETGLLVRGYRALARVQQACGDGDGALLTLKRGDEWLIQTQISAPVPCAWLAAQRARLQIGQGNLTAVLDWVQTTRQSWDAGGASARNLTAALHWAEASSVDRETPLGYFQRLTMVRCYLAQYQRDAQQQFLSLATEILAPLLVAAEANGWMSHVVEILVLQALIQQAQKETVLAQNTLARALILAKPEGYVRLFVEEGEPIRLLILGFRLWIARQPYDEQQQQLSTYIDTLLSMFDSDPGAKGSQSGPEHPAIQSPKSKIQNLVEPLTERELEILRLINSGLSNSEIASQIIVSVGTVKKHINNIFGKLGVSSRTQAIVCARTLNLL
jgi:LuxR family maltose regulon positive regulatory protein